MRLKEVVLVLLLALSPGLASAAIAFSQNITGWGTLSAGPQASGSFNPATSSTILVPMLDGAFTGRTLAYTGTVNTPSAKIAVDDTTNGNTVGMAEVPSATTGAQTISVNGGPTGDSVLGWGIVYTGVVSTGSYSGKVNTAAQTTVTGNAIVVPSGSVLVAFAVETSTAGSNFTGQTSGGVAPTDRQATFNYALNYAISEYVGTGSSVTPTWNLSAAGNVTVVQVLLTGAGGGSSIVPKVMQMSQVPAANDDYYAISLRTSR